MVVVNGATKSVFPVTVSRTDGAVMVLVEVVVDVDV